MHLNYVVISQRITSVLAYRSSSAVVSLANNRVALIEAGVLSKAGINPNDGPCTQSLASRISVMRDALVGKHVALLRKGTRLLVTGIFEQPLEVLNVTTENVDAICEHINFGGRMTPEMKTVFSFLRRARHPSLQSFLQRINECLEVGQSSEGLQTLRQYL